MYKVTFRAVGYYKDQLEDLAKDLKKIDGVVGMEICPPDYVELRLLGVKDFDSTIINPKVTLAFDNFGMYKMFLRYNNFDI